MPLRMLSQVVLRFAAIVLLFLALGFSANAQDTVTGAFEGTVTDGRTQTRVVGAFVEITNQATGIVIRRRTDAQGRFYQGLLPPGVYTIRVSASGFVAQEKEQRLFTTAPNQVVPIPFVLEPEPSAQPSPAATTTPPVP